MRQKSILFVPLVLLLLLPSCKKAESENSLTEYCEDFFTPMSMQAVDMGLSVKWGEKNMGASSPNDYGNYYAWGEVVSKSEFSWKTYKYSDGSTNEVTKYCVNTYDGNADNLKVLQPSDDVATKRLGAGWKIPTVKQWKELSDNCTWTLRDKGVEAKSKINGNTLFFPFSGYCKDKTDSYRGGYGMYWTSMLYTGYSKEACSVYIENYRDCDRASYRCYGLSVRPVYQ